VGTFYGVLLGGLATLAIARWQINEQRRAQEHAERVFLGVLVEHVNREISQNLQIVRDLISAFGQSPKARLEVWDWAVTIVHSFSNQAHDDLYRTGLQRHLPSFFEEEIRRAHGIVFDVRNRVRQARAQHIFNATYRDDGEALNERLYVEIQERIPGALADLEQADRVVEPANLPWVPSEPAASAGRRSGFLRRLVRRLRPG